MCEAGGANQLGGMSRCRVQPILLLLWRAMLLEFVHLSPRHHRSWPSCSMRACVCFTRLCGATVSAQGFGHAVLQARDAVGDNPFLLMLGDHLYKSTLPSKNCIAQLLSAFDGSVSVIGACVAPETLIGGVAVMTGTFSGDSVIAVSEIAEKPAVEYARANLIVPGVPEGQYVTAFGLYVLKPDIFRLLQESIEANIRFAGQIGLTQCLDQLRRDNGLHAFLIKGTRFDIGLDAASYVHSVNMFGV